MGNSLLKRGLSNKAVAKKVGFDYNRPTLSHQSVKSTWNKYQETNQVENNWSTQGAPKILIMEEEKEVVDLTRENRTASSNELLRILVYPVTSRIISNVLVRNGYHAYGALKKILLTETNISKRREFAVDHSDWTNERWRRIVFSDESSFSIKTQMVVLTFEDNLMKCCKKIQFNIVAQFQNQF